MVMEKLKNKVAVITGGATGIGKEIAIAYAKEGATVVVNYYKNENEANELKDIIKQITESYLFIEADVSNEYEVKNMMKKVEEKYEKIDILVCSAGIDQKVSISDMSVEDFDRIISVDLRGVFLCNKFVVEGMKRQNYGRIINITSQLGQIGGINTSHYSAAKAGVIGFTKSLARELGKNGITANCIAPGPVATEMFLKSCPPEWQKQKLESLPLGRIGKTCEVAPVAVLLASDPDGSFFTGQTLGPNGGDVML